MRRDALPDTALQSRGGTLVVTARPEAALALLLHDAAVTPEHLIAGLGAAMPAGSLRRHAPGQTLVVDHRHPPEVLRTRIARALPDGVHWLDVSHGRALIELAGPGAAEALAHGIGIDLDPERFPVGRSEPTSYGHIGVNLARTAPERYELVALRSYAAALWELLAVRCARAA
jgi:heterotetrameric sarcosine oxidase gamma subunit